MTDTTSPSSHRIVVGIDGSDSSARALEWAIHQAELTNASVLAMAVWHWPPALGWGIPLAPPYIPSEDAEAALEKELAPVRSKYTDVTIESRVVEGHPAPALVEASQGADLLVVGSRGHGEFAGMLLGSVSEHCVSNAQCPVLVLREER